MATTWCVHRYILIGEDATNPYVSGQGSGGVATSNRLVSPLAAFQARGLDVTYVAGDTVAEAVAAAKAADVAIIFGSAHSGEGHDRTDLLFYHQASHDAAAAAAAGSNNCSVTAAGVLLHISVYNSVYVQCEGFATLTSSHCCRHHRQRVLCLPESEQRG